MAGERGNRFGTREQGRRTFAEEVVSLTALYAAPLDALSHPQAIRVVRDVLLEAVVKTNNQLAAGLATPELCELLPDHHALWSEIEDVTHRLRRVATSTDPHDRDRPWLRRATSTIVSNRFQAACHAAFIDTDEIPKLVAVAYGVGLFARLELPDMARRWALGGPDSIRAAPLL